MDASKEDDQLLHQDIVRFYSHLWFSSQGKVREFVIQKFAQTLLHVKETKITMLYPLLK